MAVEVEKINAEVIAVYPDKIKIVVDNLEDFRLAGEVLQVGSYLKISDNDNAILMAIIENFSIVVNDVGKRDYAIEALPIGMIKNGKFIRGGDSLAIPPKKVEPATEEEIKKIYEQSIDPKEKFTFASLSSNPNIRISVNGNKFFNKHVAIVGSTGSGKSHTLSTIIQKAVSEKSGDFSINNSHVIIFDIHSEYKSAFPTANFIDTKNLILPYWLLNSEELEEFFLDTEANDHNQRFVFKEAIVSNRKKHFKGTEANKKKIHYDSPLYFDIDYVLEYAKAKNIELVDSGEVYATSNKEKAGQPKLTNGSLYGKLTNYVNRLENKINDNRLDFLLGQKSKDITFEETLNQLIGYQTDKQYNVTVIDLSGVPFEVLSITVSLISRMVFEYGYFYKRLRNVKNPSEKINNDIPILLVYEEAHINKINNFFNKYPSKSESDRSMFKDFFDSKFKGKQSGKNYNWERNPLR